MKHDQIQPPRWVRLSDAPGQFGVCIDTLRKWGREGHITISRPTGKISLVEVATLEGFLRSKGAA